MGEKKLIGSGMEMEYLTKYNIKVTRKNSFTGADLNKIQPFS